MLEWIVKRLTEQFNKICTESDRHANNTFLIKNETHKKLECMQSFRLLQLEQLLLLVTRSPIYQVS